MNDLVIVPHFGTYYDLSLDNIIDVLESLEWIYEKFGENSTYYISSGFIAQERKGIELLKFLGIDTKPAVILDDVLEICHDLRRHRNHINITPGDAVHALDNINFIYDGDYNNSGIIGVILSDYNLRLSEVSRNDLRKIIRLNLDTPSNSLIRYLTDTYKNAIRLRLTFRTF